METYDVAVIGGGPAGLQAALTLGRMRLRAVVLDSGEYRNDPAEHLHNLAGFDGVPPAAYRAAARRDLARYDTVEIVDARVASVGGSRGDFTVRLDDGTTYAVGSVILATGVRDTLPPVPGLADLFGTVVAHCPFCHGYEFSGGDIAILGAHGHVAGLGAMVRRIARDVVVLTDGEDLDPEVRVGVEALGALVVHARVTRVERSEAGVRVHLADGEPIDVGGLFATPTFAQSAPFAEQLGLALLPSGCIEVDAFAATSVPGVYAAGDLAHRAELPMPMASILIAAAAGQMAGAMVVREVATDPAGWSSPSRPRSPA